MEIIKLRHIGRRYVQIEVGDDFGSKIDIGTFDLVNNREKCRSIAQHLREVADELGAD